MNPKGEILLYQAKDGKINVEVNLQRETVWLAQKQIAVLFKTERSVITKHLHNIFKNKELDKDSVCAIFAHTAQDGKIYQTKFYNLDAVVSVGYRVNSNCATQFRIWATNILKRYLIDGYVLNECCLQEQRRKLEALQKAIKLIRNVKGRKELEYKEIRKEIKLVRPYVEQIWVQKHYRHLWQDINQPLQNKSTDYVKHLECWSGNVIIMNILSVTPRN